jgi:DedD protein
MATQQETQDLKRRARRRLVGAIALVLFLMIVPPLVMDLEPRPVATSLDVEIPDRKDGRLLLPPPVPAPQPEASPPAKETAAPPAEAAPSKTAETAPIKAAEPEPKAAATAPTQESGYAVVMATLSKKDNVKQLQAKLKQAGFKSYTETMKTSGGEQTRVRAGPFADKEAAEKARAKLQQLGMNPGPVAAR